MPNFQCIATIPKNLNPSLHESFPPIHTIGDKLIAALPFPNLMTDKTTNILIEFSKCIKNTVYNIINWRDNLLKACPDDSKHYIDKVIKKNNEISFAFKRSFEISPEGKVTIWDTSYKVVGNAIKEGSDIIFKGFNTTRACTINSLKSALFPNSSVVVHIESIKNSSGVDIIDESDLDKLKIPTDDLTSFNKETVITICGVLTTCGILVAIYLALKFKKICKNERRKSGELDEVYEPMNMLKSDNAEHNGKTYQNNEEIDTYIPLIGVDLSHG